MNRPLFVVALAALVALAGCSGPGDRTPEPIEGTAAPATVGADALAAAGYEAVAVEPDQVNRTGTIDVSGDVELNVQYRVRATARRAEYRSSGADPPSVFAVHAVPVVSPASVDTPIDPLGDRSTAEVVARAQRTYGDLGDLEGVENTTVTLLGTETTLATYATTAETGGARVDVFVSVASVEHEGDVVRAVAVVPRAAADGAPLGTLLDGVRHDSSA